MLPERDWEIKKTKSKKSKIYPYYRLLAKNIVNFFVYFLIVHPYICLCMRVDHFYFFSIINHTLTSSHIHKYSFVYRPKEKIIGKTLFLPWQISFHEACVIYTLINGANSVGYSNIFLSVVGIINCLNIC